MTLLPATITTRDEPSPSPADPLAQAALCSVCPKLCSTTCPVQSATGREAFAPWRISRVVVAAASAGWAAETLHQASSCTGCGACSRACLPGVTLPDESRAARAQAAGQGVLLPAAERVRARIAERGSPRPPDSWGAELAFADPTADTVLLHGCAVQRFAPGTGRAALAVARVTGAGLRTLPAPEPCCGAAALDLGLEEEARMLAAGASAALGDARRVVALAPSCARTVRDVWPSWGLVPPAVCTAPEWLTEVLPSGQAMAGQAVAWHAPCTLARGLGVVSAPLEVLARLGAQVREPARSGLDTRCSGGGAAYPQVDPAGAATVASARRRELDALGAETVTACPGAARALGATDLVELAARALGAV